MNRFLGAAAAFYAGLGAAAFARPELIPATFGGTAPTADARSEVRAVYGGLPLAIAGCLVLRPSTAPTIAVLTAGMGVARAASAAMEEQSRPVTPAFVAIEAAVAAALVAGARRRRPV